MGRISRYLLLAAFLSASSFLFIHDRHEADLAQGHCHICCASSGFVSAFDVDPRALPLTEALAQPISISFMLRRQLILISSARAPPAIRVSL